MSHGYALFETAIGHCGLRWTDAGICGACFPEGDEAQTRSRLGRHGGKETEPPPHIRQAMARVAALLAGASDDLADIELDLAGVPDFQRRVYAVARAIPPGRTLTYGEVARRLGDKLAARAVGEALGRNPIPIIVPCHRVLAASGKTGGFSAPGGVASKLKLLEIEGALSVNALPLFGGG